jgi:hypothetical protein
MVDLGNIWQEGGCIASRLILATYLFFFNAGCKHYILLYEGTEYVLPIKHVYTDQNKTIYLRNNRYLSASYSTRSEIYTPCEAASVKFHQHEQSSAFDTRIIGNSQLSHLAPLKSYQFACLLQRCASPGIMPVIGGTGTNRVVKLVCSFSLTTDLVLVM